MNTEKITEKMNHTFRSGSIALTLAAIVAVTMFACSSAAWAESLEWTVYNKGNSGLPYNGVTAIAFDAQGIVWVGTGRWWAHAGGGLAKFDGTNWTVYNTVNSGLPDNDHVSLSIDADENIWSGTENGLSKFDGTNWTVYKTNNSGLPSNQTGAPAFDAEGNAWIATFPDSGMAKFDGENWTVYRTSNSGLPNNFVSDVTIDAYGNIWAGTWGGVARFDGQNWTVYNTSNSALPLNDVSFLDADGKGNVWAGTYGGGLAKFNGAVCTAYTTANSGLPDNWIWNLSVDPRGNVWAGTKAGLVRFDGVKWTVYNTNNSGLPDNNVYYIAFDAKENIWVGTQDGGLAVFHPQPVVDFNGDGIVDSADMCIMVDQWGTDNQLCDIGPTPWGDGIVDVQDLIVLAEHLFEQENDPTLMAHWPLDETEGLFATDNIGDNDAFIVGGATWQSNSGQIDGALQLNGVDACAIAGYILNPADGPFSVIAWVKGGAPGQVIFSQSNGANWLGVDADFGCVMTELIPPAVGRFHPQPLKSEFAITDGQWHRIGFVWDGSNRALYVDGILVAEDTQNNLSNSLGGLNIGCGSNSETGTFWSGLIDDIRIYNRVVSP
jgi:sugar lactone lactonase YvrE